MTKQSEPPVDDETIHARIIDDIASGYFAGGARLKISELAERYQTSTNPVREALRILQGEGYVEFEPNKGAMVKRIDFNTVRDTYEVLRLIEPYFVGWFAEYATEQAISDLEAIQEKIEATTDMTRTVITPLDNAFHNRIADFHYNKRAAALWKSQRAALRVFTFRLPIGRSRHKAICEEHSALIAACRDHDPERATAVIRLHIDHAGQHLYEQIRMRDLQNEPQDRT
ncbi:hypothetical protein BJF93_07280 [Xaviernesmea oryzae]|uniref:HTH gntR-type domain-containing protein n=1 Tax=Xaviernesmea oryzae TaxID=464029 RepID=A0A1Q9AW99_9HYPH|nr:GntR family transcriptional regulator [Xaviernesmea oryzae]OLP59689.1 hypothetical protein BJF93_07280 [Xaviernesmea oryzae]